MNTSGPLSDVILSHPQVLPAISLREGAPRSWIQLAATGEFVSSRYGQFSITRTDLAQMLHNFRTRTPKAPTELPIDYDHLSMNPKVPGDGIAAGWVKQLQLRADGEELWAEVEWTPDGARRIGAGEYRFISPSFVKDHTHKDGTKIGTTLLAAAVTNHPFLEGMQALTLYNFDAMGDLAVLSRGACSTSATHCATVGQRVTFHPDAERTPELTDEERAKAYLITATVGGGEDEFVRLETAQGEEVGWFRIKQLAAARPLAAVAHGVRKQEEITEMSAVMSPDTMCAAKAFEKRVLALSHQIGGSTRDAIAAAAALDEAGADAYRRCGVNTERAGETVTPAVSLSVREGESFDALCIRYSAESGVPLREAIRIVSTARPDLLDAR